MKLWRVLVGDARQRLLEIPDASAQVCVTSPPYFGLRSYLDDDDPDKPHEIGQEQTPESYIEGLLAVFAQVYRILRPDGTLWLNLGDSYAGSGPNRQTGLDALGKSREVRNGRGLDSRTIRWPGIQHKELIGIPWMVAFALRRQGWRIRAENIWAKPACMPESVKDRTTRAHEHIFMLTKQADYFYDWQAVVEPFADKRMGRDGGKKPSERNVGGRTDGYTKPNGIDPSANGGRNMRSVWHLPPEPNRAAVQSVRRVRVAPDAADDDTTRITSPDCPLHGDRPVLVPSAAYGGPGAGMLNRNEHSNDRRVQEPQGDSAPTVQHPGEDLAGGSPDCASPSCAEPATDHSKQSHRRDLAPETIPPCTVSAGTHDHTGRTSEEPESFEHGPDRHESSISTGGYPSHPAPNKAPGSSDRPCSVVEVSSPLASCKCTYYKDDTQNTAHFATFPTEIPRRAILAGSRPGDLVVDPFTGSGTTGRIAIQLGRRFIGTELKAEYAAMAMRRIREMEEQIAGMLFNPQGGTLG